MISSLTDRYSSVPVFAYLLCFAFVVQNKTKQLYYIHIWFSLLRFRKKLSMQIDTKLINIKTILKLFLS